MSTAATIIDRAQRLLGTIEAGEISTDDEYEDGLVALNAMLSSWNNDGLMCYATRTETLTLSASDASYTIGPSGDLDTVRPVVVEAAWVVDNNQTYPCQVITDSQYDAISNKTQEGDWPNRVNYRGTMATGTLYVYPVPNATRTLKVRTRTPLEAFDAITDSVTLPPGWEDAMAFNLAIRFAPEFQVSPSADVVQIAREAKAGIKNTNVRPMLAVNEIGFINNGRSNIISDE